ncbi:MAG: hypothetical protein DSO03_06915, partial [Hadesarchaea archaeon]
RRKGGRGVGEILERIRGVDQKMGTITQAFDARLVAGKAHLAHASRLALLAHSRGMGFADSLALELICWAAAERQISRALEKMGLKEDSIAIGLVSVGEEKKAVEKALEEILRETEMEREDGVLDLSPSKERLLLERFHLPKGMVRKLGVQKLVLERIALLALER